MLFARCTHLIPLDITRRCSSISTHHVMPSFKPLKSSDRLKTISSNVVLVSNSYDIFQNLALEDWIYSNSLFQNNSCLLFMWKDDPCIVIGRHQNPWTECHLTKCHQNKIQVCRRNSGGGTVYHDLGNINMSFMTHRQNYCRKHNLSFISSILKSNYGIQTEISPREDLVTRDGLKVSGTASKLSSRNSYHHCTLLVSVDTDKLKSCIRKDPQENIKSRATSSTRSSVINLNQLKTGIETDDVIKSLSEGYEKRSVFSVDPVDDKMFVGVREKFESFKSWNWIYGKTPRFSLNHSFVFNGVPGTIDITVNRGMIEDVSVDYYNQKSEINLKNVPFTSENVAMGLSVWRSEEILTSDWSLFIQNIIQKLVDDSFE